MGRKTKRASRDIYIALLTKVPTDWPLSYITQALHRRFTSLIAIYRICVFPEVDNTDRIFISMYNEDDYLKLQEFKSLIIRRKEIPMIFNDWIMKAAKFPSNKKEIAEVPATLRIPELQMRNSGISKYLNDVVIALEEIGGSDLIGVSLLYHHRRFCLRSFGFASYKNQQAMLMQLYKCIDINGDIVMCEEASSVPFVVLKSCGLIENRSVLWTEDLNRVNWLTIITETISDSEDEILQLDSDHEYDDDLNLVKKV